MLVLSFVVGATWDWCLEPGIPQVLHLGPVPQPVKRAFLDVLERLKVQPAEDWTYRLGEGSGTRSLIKAMDS